MDEIVKINYKAGQPTVSARELYKALSREGGLAGTERFSKWFKRYAGYGFKENEDYSPPHKTIWVQMEGGREVFRWLEDYDLTIEMAKQICMLQRTEFGRKCRQYFIDLQKSWNSPEKVYARALEMADKALAKLGTGL